MTANTPIEYQTYTNDPDLLALVELYKTAYKEWMAASRTLMKTKTGAEGFETVLKASLEKSEALHQVESQLTMLFVAALDANKS